MCQISQFEYKCNSSACKTPERTDTEINVLRYCDWYTNRQPCTGMKASMSDEHSHERKHTATKTVRIKKCRLCQPAIRPIEQGIWIGLLLLTVVSISYCGSSSSDVFNCAWCLAMLHALLLTFPAAYRRPQEIETVQRSIEISPTPGKTCAEYCSKLQTSPRTTHVAVDLAAKTIGKEQVGQQRLVLIAASIYMASHLMSEPEDAHKIQEVVAVDLWQAYQKLLDRADELVTGELVCHGADVSKLPRPW
ncbi:hypothetical protein CLAFUW4_12760 [Fulvia fulva]|uniref:Transcription factor TFIIB cyclin-like domain-containing protein n=1 Tax=Passalora fulva TaxID=5499 RepID=A0A9Q8PK00_PASFU|nr:uncharacterized protein CLAFUR5_12626 [Fulvia fulva]KAK4611695.1 hypothetical protein CLAFUR4_12764 [Fulvia fulva]KAK4612386.1 hypothetical protein CLAFUR0_12770 [Fulvia fulva]UJO23895.1 hypothetical protein CLAFUR5_12626 [Fulvia fulva]WPV21587.1 hypothetical protein CLAFUW4_12760 [Fulvia fulva]WPV36159.1 hypothetical protein CLAFUW7_12767 [Fulvia fulva]